jgi:menaquinone-dependent protoporphyrinogen oxidase
MSTLVLYASLTGNTKAVAEYIAEKTNGVAMDIKNAPNDLSKYDTVIFGSRVHAGGVSKPMQKYIGENYDILLQKKVAYYLCCMFTGDKAEKQMVNASVLLGISNGTYFVAGKKLVTDGKQIDEFIAKLDSIGIGDMI